MARQILTDLDFNNVSKITNLVQSTANGEPVVHEQLEALQRGLDFKDGARVAASTNITLAAPGATIDGVALAVNDRVLLYGQTTASENGIYIWNGAGVAMTRALDADTFTALETAIVTVEEGTDAGVTYKQSAVNGTIDVDAISWSSFGVAAPTASTTVAGLAEIATQAEVDTGTDTGRYVTPSTLKNASYLPNIFAASIGDGVSTSITIAHNLNSRDVHVKVYRDSGNYDEVEVEVRHATVNNVTLIFSSPPAINAFRCVVLG